MNKFTIIRDTREKATGGWFFDVDPYCDGTTIAQLKAGDYTVAGLEDFICIERKQSVDEFAHNCIEKRWRRCMEKMHQCKHSYLIFEFSWADIDNYPASAKVPAHVKAKLRISPALIKKVVADARERYGIHILACGNIFKAEQAAYRILKRAHELSLRR